jgi:3-oxoacyl-[acyl-carrier protein] reductase
MSSPAEPLPGEPAPAEWHARRAAPLLVWLALLVLLGLSAAGVPRAIEALTTEHLQQDAEHSAVALVRHMQRHVPDLEFVFDGEGPPPSAFGDIDAGMWADTLQRTMVSPLLFVQRVIDGMQQRRFGRIVAISSAMVKSPNPLMSMSHGPRLGLTGVLKGLSKSAVAHNVTINTLLPERFDTGRQQQMAELVMQHRGLTHDEARAEQVASIKAGRLGRPEEFGDTFAFVCSVQAGFMSGQSIQLDGGSYDGVF